MNLGEHNPKLMGVFRIEDGCSMGEFEQQAQAFVKDLITVHPAFGGLGILNGTRGPYPLVDETASNVAALVRHWGWDRGRPENFDRLDENGELTVASKGRSIASFKLSMTNPNKNWDDKVSVNAARRGAGPQRDMRGVVNITLPRVNFPEFRTDLQLARRLVDVVVRHWPVQSLQYGFYGLNNVVNWGPGSPRGRDNQELNWLCYSDDPSLAEALPPEVHVDPLGQGILMQLSPEILSHHNPEHVVWAERVREALRAAGKLALERPSVQQGETMA
jgi:hypothetical protein